MLTEAEILQFIQEDSTSTKKYLAGMGQRYYEGDHDIKKYKLYYYNSDGVLVEDKTRSNIKISHPFFTELVDQAVQYMLSGDEEFIKSDKPELQAELNKYFVDDENFVGELYEVLTGCVAKGFEYMYAYKNSEGRLAFECADSLGVVEVRAKDTDSNTDNVIYWYIDRVEKSNKKIKRIQVWDKDNTYFYVQTDEGELLKDESVELNPRPHVILTDSKGQRYFENFGFIPFFRLDYCQKQFSALKPIKELIDDYDLMSCGLSNNLQDASEYLVVVKGFQGDNIEELMQNVKTKKHIAVDGSDGGDVEFKTVDIPFQARQTKLDLDEKNIYRFGMGFNSAQMGDGNITNIVIKSRYALLDLKCNKLEIRLKQFLRKILKIVLEEINKNNGTDYQMKDIYFDFDREVMTNAQDNAQIELIEAQEEQTRINTLLSLNSVIDDETIVQLICDCLDIDYEMIKDKLPDDEEAMNQNAINTLEGVAVDEQQTKGSAKNPII